ncbi:MAG: TetR family transcriptional regulator [Sporichthyaceae bacterium]
MTAEVPDGRSTRWEAHRRTRREELVDAAVRAIRVHGAGVGMDEVAAEAATSKAAVYRYFADRGDLYVAVCTRVTERLVAQLSSALAAEREPGRQLAAAIDAYLRVIEADPDVYRFVVARPVPDRLGGAGCADPVRDLSALVGDHVATLIATRLEDAGVESSSAGPWGHGIVGLVRSAADHWLDQRSPMSLPMSRADLRDHLTDLAWSGLAGILAATGREVDPTPLTWRS